MRFRSYTVNFARENLMKHIFWKFEFFSKKIKLFLQKILDIWSKYLSSSAIKNRDN